MRHPTKSQFALSFIVLVSLSFVWVIFAASSLGNFGKLFVNEGWAYKFIGDKIVNDTITKDHLKIWTIQRNNIENTTITPGDVDKTQIQIRTGWLKCKNSDEAIQSVNEDGSVNCIQIKI